MSMNFTSKIGTDKNIVFQSNKNEIDRNLPETGGKTPSSSLQRKKNGFSQDNTPNPYLSFFHPYSQSSGAPSAPPTNKLEKLLKEKEYFQQETLKLTTLLEIQLQKFHRLLLEKDQLEICLETNRSETSYLRQKIYDLNHKNKNYIVFNALLKNIFHTYNVSDLFELEKELQRLAHYDREKKASTSSSSNKEKDL